MEKPSWLKVRAPISKECCNVKNLLRSCGVSTVCEQAACPNIGECWNKKHAAFMILGEICTRSCAFCNVKKGKPGNLDTEEPKKIAEAVKAMNLSYVVITSVTRDDLPDGGASVFCDVIDEIRKISNNVIVEILTPDFRNKHGIIEKIVQHKPDVFNHNIETVSRLYKTIRRGADYEYSLELLSNVKKLDNAIFTKSGMMLGLGEEQEEVLSVLNDLRTANVDFITIGQYLPPSENHAQLQKYITPEEFEFYKKVSIDIGFKMVSSSPLTRSSYFAEDDFWEMKSRHERSK